MNLAALLTGGWQGSLAVAGLTALVVIPTTIYLTAQPYRLAISRMETARAEDLADSQREALAQFTADASVVHSAAVRLSGFQTDLKARFAAVSKDLTHAIQSHPLPVDCKPDTGRMRALQAAVDAANSALGSKPVPAVSGHP